MNVNKLASQDANKWARAEMFFGQGAGTRRKLLSAEITDKAAKVPGYEKAFEKALSKQNWADHAIKAAKERKRLDRSGILRKNMGALLRGDRRGMSNGFAAVVIVAGVARATGYDKVVYDRAKAEYDKLKQQWRRRSIKSVPTVSGS